MSQHKEQAEIRFAIGAGERIVCSVGPEREPDYHAVLRAARGLASQLRELAADREAELIEALNARLHLAEHARALDVLLAALEGQTAGAVRRLIRTDRHMIGVYAGTKRRDLRVAGEHLGEVELGRDGTWTGHLSRSLGGSSFAMGGTENLPALVERMAAAAALYTARANAQAKARAFARAEG